MILRTRALTEQNGTFTGIVYQYISGGIIDILDETPEHDNVNDALAAADVLRHACSVSN